MSRLPAPRRSSSWRATNARLAAAGCVGILVALGTAPIAQALDDGSSDTSATSDPSTPASDQPTTTPTSDPGTSPTQAPDPTPSKSGDGPKPAGATTTATATVTPDYGYRKYRIGVQVKSGSYVPAGTTTAGSTVKIVETGPGVTGGRQTTTCTTDASTAQTGSTATFCEGGGIPLRNPHPPVRRSLSDPFAEFYFAAPGDTVVLTQTSAQPHLVIDTSTKTLDPCEAVAGPFCAETPDQVFNDPGLPPVAHDDSASTGSDGKVTITVGHNDSTGGDGAPLTGFSVTQDPSHGTVTVHNSPHLVAGEPTVTYKADAGFHGTDTFRYRIETANGADTAKVTVTVPGGTTSVNRPAALPDTGGVDERLLGVGLGMVAAGGVFVALGRRRRYADD